jgi:hypothetical protein
VYPLHDYEMITVLSEPPEVATALFDALQSLSHLRTLVLQTHFAWRRILDRFRTVAARLHHLELRTHHRRGLVSIDALRFLHCGGLPLCGQASEVVLQVEDWTDFNGEALWTGIGDMPNIRRVDVQIFGDAMTGYGEEVRGSVRVCRVKGAVG